MQRSEQGAASKRVAKFEWLTLISVFATPIFWSKMGRIADMLRVLKATRMMWWTTPAPGIECAKGVIVEQRITGGGRPHAC